MSVAAIMAPPAGEAAPHSEAFGIWSPGRFDTCPQRLHDRYAVRGPDGKLYPAWHPPVARHPVTRRSCRFGHEHGRDPRGSKLYRWVARHLGGGVPFGLANEALDAYAARHAGTPTRHEDHFGHKVEWQNGVRMRAPGGPRGVRCDFLTKVHQGTHSPDAFANNVHELIYAVRCSDGTRLLATMLVAFGDANGFERNCDTALVPLATKLPFGPGRGARFIPDRHCAAAEVLVPDGQSSAFGRELWTSDSRIVTRSGRRLARFDPQFGVRNPSRYHDPGRPDALGRIIDLCRETEPNGDRARSPLCAGAERLAWDDPASPFDGGRREVLVRASEVRNAGGPRRWYTDPFGGRASKRPFPGSLCQLIAPISNARTQSARQRAKRFGGDRTYSGRGVHAPN